MERNDFMAAVMSIIKETKESAVWKMFETKFPVEIKKEKFVELVSARILGAYRQDIIANPSILEVTNNEIETYVKMNF